MTKKDIFIDNNIAKNFANPLDPEYKKLIKWLKKFNYDSNNRNAYLMVSNKLLFEYVATSGNSLSSNSIIAIIGELTKQGRLIKISNEQIKEFKQKYFTNKVKRRLTSNKEDQEHIPVVLLSDRKYALTLDEKFTDDLLNFPSFNATVGKKPSDIPYDK
jgi:hypothetical protein